MSVCGAFDDGTTANTSYKQEGQSMSHNYTSPGRYNITVLCSNRLGWNSNHTIASVDIPIGALSITSASQFPSVDSNTGFDITIQGAGTGSCFVLDFGR